MAEWLADIRPVAPDEAVRAVVAVLSRHVDPGQVDKVRHALPKSIRQSWVAVEQAVPETVD